MPSLESSPGEENKEPTLDDELVNNTYYLASRFNGERPAGRAYFQAQEFIFSHSADLDLSVYRFQLERIYHVAVLGIKPPQDAEDRLNSILSAGEHVQLPSMLLKVLIVRRLQQTKNAPWVEKHYRPGKEFPLT